MRNKSINMSFLFSNELYLNIYTYRFFCLTLFTIQIWYFASSEFFSQKGKERRLFKKLLFYLWPWFSRVKCKMVDVMIKVNHWSGLWLETIIQQSSWVYSGFFFLIFDFKDTILCFNKLSELILDCTRWITHPGKMHMNGLMIFYLLLNHYFEDWQIQLWGSSSASLSDNAPFLRHNTLYLKQTII